MSGHRSVETERTECRTGNEIIPGFVLRKALGVLPPEVLRPNPDELQFTKQYFSAFGNSSLIPTLQEYEIDSVIIAGIFLHGCIRSTAIDAYERGYEVWIADDAVGSDEPRPR